MERLRGWIRRVNQKLQPPWILWANETAEKKTTIEIRQWLPYPLALFLLGWYVASPSIAVVISFVTAAGMVLAAFLWARVMARQLTGRRVLQSVAMQVGDELEELVTLQNDSLLPALWAEFIDRSNIPFYTLTSVRAIGGKSTQTWHVHTICTRRGLFHLGPWELISGDPFDFFKVRQVYKNAQELLVYPPLAVLPEELLVHRGAAGEHRPLNQPLEAQTIDGMTVREYVQGDPLHHIHWKTLARRNTPYVKIFEPEAASRVWILPDLDARVQLGEGDDSTVETEVLLAASLAARLLRDKISVGVFSGGENPAAVLPQRGQAHLWPILELLAPLQPAPERSLVRCLEQMRPLVTSRDLLVVITPALTMDWVYTVQRLSHGRRGSSILAILLDPLSFGGEGSAEALMPALVQAGVQVKVVRRGEIQPLAGAYGELSRWEFVTMGTGKAIARQAPRRMASIFAGQAGNREKP
jgi:uncharacterized protein (DUF58 family)